MPGRLTHPRISITERQATTFPTLTLPDHLRRSIDALGYTSPTLIQERVIPLVVAGHDVAAEAPTGSGKTVAFTLPLIQCLCARPSEEGSRAVRVLTLVPTRELALQVAASFKVFTRFAEPAPRVVAVIGGQPIEQQITALRTGASVVVATPGRLLDLLECGEIDLSLLETLVLDEADKLLDAGFSEELQGLLDQLPIEHQTLLFSATLPAKVLKLASRVLRDPITVRIDEEATPIEGIEQRVFHVNREKRRPLLQRLLSTENWGQTLVFVATQRATENLAAKLRTAGFSAEALHGGLEQADRIRALNHFKRGSVATLISTDLAARGIDVPLLGAVVNYDLPRSTQGYVHRIGRTGRAGATGVAVSFVDNDSEAHFRLIEKRNQIKLTREQVPGFELTDEVALRAKGKPGVKGKRKSKKDKLREKAAREQAGASPPEASE
jgi:ATP-dependent RNA helicase RhlE